MGVGGLGVVCWVAYNGPTEQAPIAAVVPVVTPEVTASPLMATAPTVVLVVPTSTPPPPPKPKPVPTSKKVEPEPVPAVVAPPTTTAPPEPEPEPEPKLVASVVTAAESFLPLDIPYLWGGKTTKGMDCSGFIWNVLKRAGYDVPYRTSGALKSWADPVSGGEALPGDLVFWPGHAAIYAGDGRIYDSGTRRGVAERAIWGSPTYGRIPTGEDGS